MDIIDKKDRKLLYHLSKDARASDTQLAKKIGMSKNSVKYRRERLQKEGIISHFAAVINLGALGYNTFTILLKFNTDIYEMPHLIDYFKAHPYTDWLASLSGPWDLFVEVIIKDMDHLQYYLHTMVEHFGPVLNAYEVFLSGEILRVEHLVEDFYRDLKLSPPLLPKRVVQRQHIDETDRSILHLLNQNSTLPYLKMARQLGYSLDVIRYRMKKLKENGVIIKSFAETSLKTLGYTEYLGILNLKNTSQEQLTKLKRTIQISSAITYAFFDVLSLRLVFVCAFRTAEGIDHLFRNLRKQFGAVIDKEEYLILKEHLLFNLFPKGLLSFKEVVME